METGAGCLTIIIGLMIVYGELFLFSGTFRSELIKDGMDDFGGICAFLAIIVNFFIVFYLIRVVLKSSEEKRTAKERERKQHIQDEISTIVQRYTVQNPTEKSNVPNIAEVESPMLDSEVVFCVKSYIREAEEQELKIIELKEQIQEILNGDSCLSDEQRLEYLKQKEPLLQSLNAELQKAQKPQNERKIVLNETTSHELESIRTVIQEIGNSQKIRNMNEQEWKTVTEPMLPDELRYFKSATTPIILRLMDHCFCIFSKTILVFTLEGKFVTALQRICFTFNIERNRERAYFDLERQAYSANIVGTDSKCVDKGEERHTWCHTCKDGSMDMRYRNNYRINYRYDTMEYGKIRLSVADFVEEFKFSSEKALLIAEKAADEVSNKKIERETNNESALINLLQLLVPSSKSARALEEYYSKVDAPQKKYCYIERS